MFFFTNIHGLCQELKTKTVSHGAALAYQILMLIMLTPWSLIAHFLRSYGSPAIAQQTLTAALFGVAAQYVGVLLAGLQFMYYSKQLNTQGRLLSFAALYWVVTVRYVLRTIVFVAGTALALALAMQMQLISKAALAGLLFGLVFNPDLQLVAHLAFPLIFGLTYQWLFHEALQELERA